MSVEQSKFIEKKLLKNDINIEIVRKMSLLLLLFFPIRFVNGHLVNVTNTYALSICSMSMFSCLTSVLPIHLQKVIIDLVVIQYRGLVEWGFYRLFHISPPQFSETSTVSHVCKHTIGHRRLFFFVDDNLEKQTSEYDRMTASSSQHSQRCFFILIQEDEIQPVLYVWIARTSARSHHTTFLSHTLQIVLYDIYVRVSRQ